MIALVRDKMYDTYSRNFRIITLIILNFSLSKFCILYLDLYREKLINLLINILWYLKIIGDLMRRHLNVIYHFYE